MLSTKNFVFLAFPKTGSTFVRDVIKGSHVRFRRRYAWLPAFLWRQGVYEEVLLNSGLHKGKFQHGSRRDLPRRWKSRQIVSVLRHPAARFQSIYRFQMWCRKLPQNTEELKLQYPAFPNISPEEFLDWMTKNNHIRNGEMVRLGLGFQSIKMIEFFSSKDLFEKIQDGMYKTQLELLEAFLVDTKDIIFLDQARLASGLKGLFRGHPMESEVIRALESVSSSNVTATIKKYYEPEPITPELLAEVERNEGFMIEFMKRRSLLD